MALAFPAEYRVRARSLRAKGWTLGAIAEQLGTGMSTVSPWVSDISTPQLEVARAGRMIEARSRASSLNRDSFRTKRQAAFNLGQADLLTCRDALAIGLYWGEGDKRATDSDGKSQTASWAVTNIDFDVIKECLEWARRYGQPPDAFRVDIYAHKTSSATDEEIRHYWAALGIAPTSIYVSRRLEGVNQVRKTKSPYGVCHLRAKKNGVPLFCRFLGQVFQLTGALPPAVAVAGIAVSQSKVGS